MGRGTVLTGVLSGNWHGRQGSNANKERTEQIKSEMRDKTKRMYVEKRREGELPAEEVNNGSNQRTGGVLMLFFWAVGDHGLRLLDLSIALGDGRLSLSLSFPLSKFQY